VPPIDSTSDAGQIELQAACKVPEQSTIKTKPDIGTKWGLLLNHRASQLADVLMQPRFAVGPDKTGWESGLQVARNHHNVRLD
jgi:hypothetical protein